MLDSPVRKPASMSGCKMNLQDASLPSSVRAALLAGQAPQTRFTGLACDQANVPGGTTP